MKSQSLRRVTACALAVGVALLFGSGSAANAAEPGSTPGASTTPSTTPSSSTTYQKVPDTFSLTVSPTRIVVDPTQVGDPQTLLVVNTGEAPLTVTVENRDFIGARNGTMAFADSAPYSASQWVTVTPASFTLAPGGSQTVTAAIQLPAHPEPGDHQVALVFMVPALATADNITINRGVGVPLYVATPGKTDDSVTLSDLSAPGFSSGRSIDVSATLTSTGNVHRDFRDQTPLILHAGGGSVAFPDFTVVRGGVRDVSTSWHAPFMCICHVAVSFVNDDGQTQHQSVRIIVFPVKLALGVLAGLLAIVLLVAWRRRRFAGRVHLAAALLNGGRGVPAH